MVVSGCLMAWYWNPFAGCSRLRFLLIATQVEQSDRRCTAPQMHPLRNSPEIAQIQVNKSPLNLDLRVLGDTIFAISSPLSLNNFFCVIFLPTLSNVYMSICWTLQALCLCLCLCHCLCLCVSSYDFWIAFIISFQNMGSVKHTSRDNDHLRSDDGHS